ncbi:MAG: NAD(P)H-binding protein [Bacteroidia bacterium]|nr:NAD(P)H-binding protein [Bacteroidia bacterium]
MGTVAVAGGTGMLGQPVVRRLLAEGWQVRVLTTRPGKAAACFGPQVQEVAGDIGDETALLRLMEGCTALHLSLQGGPSEAEYQRIEAEGTRLAAAAAVRQGLRRVSMTSGMAVSFLTPEQAAGQDPAYASARAKRQAEAHLMASGAAYTIFRPTSFLDTFGKYIRGRYAVSFGGFNPSFHWIAAEDYARWVCASYRSDAARNRIYPVAGPELLPMEEAARLYFGIAAPEVRQVQIPGWLLRGMARFIPPLRTGLKMMAAAADVQEEPAEALWRDLGGPVFTVESYCRRLAEMRKGSAAARNKGAAG